MKQKKKKQLTYWLKVAVIGMALGFALQFVRAWTEPAAAPPGGNVAAPINTGAQKQVKLGDICTTVTGTEKCLSAIGGTTTGSCGDGSCNNGETCSSCPGDCGSCPVQPPTTQYYQCPYVSGGGICTTTCLGQMQTSPTCTYTAWGCTGEGGPYCCGWAPPDGIGTSNCTPV